MLWLTGLVALSLISFGWLTQRSGPLESPLSSSAQRPQAASPSSLSDAAQPQLKAAPSQAAQPKRAAGAQATHAPSLSEALSDPSYGLERLEGDSAADKEPKRPLHAELKKVSPSPSSASWSPGQTLNLGWHETQLPEGEGSARVRLSLSAESAEGHRVAAALRPRVLKSLYFLLSHRASGALTLPDAEERLARDLGERVDRLSRAHKLEVHIEGLEVRFE